jgi:sarcosine oxidase, subunit gamma
MLKTEVGLSSIIRVQTWDTAASVPPAVEQVLGVGWPVSVGTVARGLGNIICVGPTDWLVIGSDPDATSWLERLDAAFAGSSFRATNVSQALARIELNGPEVRDLLSKGCALDLHSSQFRPDHSARTRLAGMPVIVHCIAADRFECIVTLSYAGYLLAWLADASIEFSGSETSTARLYRSTVQ